MSNIAIGIINKIIKCTRYITNDNVETEQIDVDSSTNMINSNYIIENITYTNDTIELLKTRIETDDCSICLDNYKGGNIVTSITILKCGHVFHSDCINKWIKFNGKISYCPLCKDQISNMKTLNWVI